MEYREHALRYEDYCDLRESVGWMLFDKEQTERAINRSLYTVVAFDGQTAVGMGRLIGDGMYDIIADVVVRPSHQKQGIGTQIMKMLIAYAESTTPPGGRTSVQLIAEKGKALFYEKLGFRLLPHEACGSGMRKVIRR